jgi:hypothetical protein
VPSLTHPEAVFLGLDIHKDSISVGVLNPGHERPDVEKIFHDEESVHRLIDRFPDRSLLWACYEAGPPATTWPDCSSPSGSIVRSSPHR